MLLLCAAVAAAAYLIGSVNIAITVTRFLLHDDVRAHGSGNAGAANVARVYGKWMGLITLVGDMLKTMLAMYIGSLIGGLAQSANAAQIGAAVAVVACMLGHCFPAFYGFKGGKGVSVAAGAGLMLDYRVFLICIGVYLIVVLASRRASVGSLAGTLAIPFAMLIFALDALTIGLGIFIAASVWFMHRENIARLIRGEEKQFNFGHDPHKNAKS